MLPSSGSQNEDIVPDDFWDIPPLILKSSTSHRDTAIGLNLTPK